jgi:hypothetical protein
VTPPYKPQKNGAAERENRTIVEAARSMLLSSKLPKELWESVYVYFTLSGRRFKWGMDTAEIKGVDE